jgi:tellurite resistance protein TerC
MTDSVWLWVGFNMFVLAMLALDLGVFHRKAHVVSLKESLTWTVVWVALALVFNAGVWHYSVFRQGSCGARAASFERTPADAL